MHSLLTLSMMDCTGIMKLSCKAGTVTLFKYLRIIMRFYLVEYDSVFLSSKRAIHGSLMCNSRF
jgi:hypothetical protein